MKTLVVGNSLDTLPIVEQILKSEPDQEVLIFATEGVLPYDRHFLPGLLVDEIDDKGLFKSAEIFLAGHKPKMITGEKLSRISVKRKYLTTEKKVQIDYDRLILLDTGHFILPTIKGHQKKGIFDCWQLPSIKDLRKHLPFVDTVTVIVSNIQGFNMACALSQLKKEVTVVSSAPSLLPDFFDEETGLLLKQILEGKGVRVYADNAIEEILGDNEIKAVKFKSGKVIAADALIIDELRVDIRMLSEPTLGTHDQICVESSFKPPVLPFEPTHFGLNVLQGFFAGWTKLPEGGREFLKFDGPQNIYKKIFAHGDHLAGLVILNAPQDNENLLGILQRRDNVVDREESIL